MRKELEPCRNVISEAKVWGEAAETEATGKEWYRGDIVPVHNAITKNRIKEGYPVGNVRAPGVTFP